MTSPNTQQNNWTVVKPVSFTLFLVKCQWNTWRYLHSPTFQCTVRLALDIYWHTRDRTNWLLRNIIANGSLQNYNYFLLSNKNLEHFCDHKNKDLWINIRAQILCSMNWVFGGFTPCPHLRPSLRWKQFVQIILSTQTVASYELQGCTTDLYYPRSPQISMLVGQALNLRNRTRVPPVYFSLYKDRILLNKPYLIKSEIHGSTKSS